MADVYIVVFSVIGILISLPALLVALALLLPGVVGRSASRISRTPGKCLVLGIPVAAAFFLWIAISSQVNFGPVKATAFAAGITGLGLGVVGAAGFAWHISERLGAISGPKSKIANLLRGAVIFELACFFPIIGWFLFLPLAGALSLGAAVFGLLSWMPGPRVQQAAAMPAGNR